jgi:DNA-binding MarR family transcriptional regulator
MGAHESRSPAPRRADADADVTASLDAIRRIVRVLRLSSSATEKAHGVSLAQLFVLHELANGGPYSIADLSGRTATDPSSVSVVVARLVERGLAARSASAADARRAEIAITAAGRALLRKAPVPAQQRLISSIAALPKAERQSLAATLTTVVAAMGMGDETATMFFEKDEPAPRPRKKSVDR